MSKTQEIIDKILNAKNPINVNGKIEDLNDYQEIFKDGRFSDSGFSFLYNAKTGSLILYEWTNWQPPISGYQITTLEDYIIRMLYNCDDNHFQRYIDGLRKIFKP